MPQLLLKNEAGAFADAPGLILDWELFTEVAFAFEK